jgi:hypothetical protein
MVSEFRIIAICLSLEPSAGASRLGQKMLHRERQALGPLGGLLLKRVLSSALFPSSEPS